MLKKVMPTSYLLLAIILILLIHFIFPVTTFIYLPWSLMGLLPLILGVVLNLIADRDLKRGQTTVKPFQQSSTLITDRAYRISRHPMYLGFLLILFGVSLMLGSASPYLVMIVFAVLMEFLFIREEERMLEEQFQEKWIQYKSKVRKWF